MARPMIVVRGRLIAAPSYRPADRASGRAASLGALVEEAGPRGARRADGMATVMIRFTGLAAELLRAQRLRAGAHVTATGLMGEPEAMIDGTGRAWAMPTVDGETMQPDPIGEAMAREARADRAATLRVEDDPLACVRPGEYVGDGSPRTAGGVPFEPLSGITVGEIRPLDPADPDLIASRACGARGRA